MQKSVEPEAQSRPGTPTAATPEATFSIVLALSFAHFLNDMMQSLLPAIYPIIKDAYHLDFGAGAGLPEKASPSMSSGITFGMLV